MEQRKLTVGISFWKTGQPLPPEVQEAFRGKVEGVEWLDVEMDAPEDFVELCDVLNIKRVSVNISPSGLTVDDFQIIKASDIQQEGQFLTCPGILTLLFEPDAPLLVLRPTERVLQLAREQIPARLIQEAVWYIKNVKESSEEKRIARDPETPGNIPWCDRNFRILVSALKRMSKREGRPWSPADLYTEDRVIRLATPYLRVYRRMLDFAAHAASAGWLQLRWSPKDTIIVGETLAFLNGERVDKIEEDCPNVHICL